jgi:NhaP-type Na+/H+ or K+/H+ antiporter
VREIRTVPDRPAPGAAAGAALGLAAGLLLGWLWADKSRDVALAVSFVFAGLVAATAGGSSAWRPFAVGMTASAVLLAVGIVWVS